MTAKRDTKGKTTKVEPPKVTGFQRFLQRAGYTKEEDAWTVARGTIRVTWQLGGETGHGLDGDQISKSLPAEPEPEFEEFDNLLMKLCPTIGFLQYKMLCKDVVKKDTTNDCGYYGDKTVTGSKEAGLRDIYNWLQRHDLYKD